mmetsp:Transcript_15002/g.40959  ORF Transcript_15002/g.40959 Transcript_15002/m.40959 type:complete len:217 (-) Transcript_15002:2914-3564(-)
MCAWYLRTSLGLNERTPRSTDWPGLRHAVSRPSLTSAAVPLPGPVTLHRDVAAVEYKPGGAGGVVFTGDVEVSRRDRRRIHVALNLRDGFLRRGDEGHDANADDLIAQRVGRDDTVPRALAVELHRAKVHDAVHVDHPLALVRLALGLGLCAGVLEPRIHRLLRRRRLFLLDDGEHGGSEQRGLDLDRERVHRVRLEQHGGRLRHEPIVPPVVLRH